MRSACGYGDEAPTEAHFSQVKRRLKKKGFKVIERFLRGEAIRLKSSNPMLKAGLVQASAVDSTDLKAWSSRAPEDSTRGLRGSRG